jgi:hypothetical protein
MKKTLLSLFTLLYIAVNSQTNSSNSESLKSNNYSFEGVIESIEFYAGDNKGNRLPKSSIIWENGSGYFHNSDGTDAKGYSLAKIKLYKIYKGSDLTNQDYAYILTSTEGLQVYYTQVGKDTILNQMNFNNPHDNNFIIMPAMKNYRMIFFANKNSKNNFIVQDNASVFYYNSNYQANYSGTQPQEYASNNDKRFYSENELNTFLSAIPNININSKPKFEIAQKKSTIDNQEENQKINNTNSIDYQQNLKNYNERFEILKSLQKQIITQNKSLLIDNLTVNIQNGRIVGPDPTPSYEFDIYVSANNTSTYLQNVLMRIQYNTSAFGSNIVANNKVTITRAPAFNTSTYINPQTGVTDNTSSVINFAMGDDFSQTSWNRVQMTTTPKLLCTVKIVIQNCNQNANINFTDVSFTSGFSFFTPSATSNFSVSGTYNNTNYGGSLTTQPCKPIITSFNNNVPAGVNQVLTIVGKNFGGNKGSGTVIFKNADKGTTYPPQVGPNKGGIQQYDVIRWTHDTIKIKMPSTIDSTIADRVVPGSGKFTVYNRYTYNTESSTKLIIDYAVTQYPDGGLLYPYRKVGLKLAGLNGGNGYKVQINQNIITGIANSKPAIKKGLRAWTCATGINWFLGNDTTAGIGNSNLCIVDTGNFSALMKTTPTVRSCTTSLGIPVFYLKSFNIKIKLNPSLGPWNTDTASAIPSGQYDFYSAISHEFGHAHGVSHINDSLVDLMWWQGYSTGYTALGRKLVKYSPGAVSAGNYVADNLVGGLTCATNHFTVLAQSCEDAIGVKKNYGDLFNITVSPNPSSTNEGLKVKFNLTQQQNVNIALYDITGKLISTSNLVGIKDDDYLFSNNNLEAGIYLLQISIGSKKQSYKIVKQ